MSSSSPREFADDSIDSTPSSGAPFPFQRGAIVALRRQQATQRAPMLQPQQRQTAGSATTTITADPPQEEQPTLVLRLRAESDARTRRHIQWTEDTVDNEGMGKKKSKVCCIYHKTRDFGESSSEDDSSQSSDSETGSDNLEGSGEPRRCGGHRRGRQRRSRTPKDKEDGGDNSKPGNRRASPNAYERVPRVNKETGH